MVCFDMDVHLGMKMITCALFLKLQVNLLLYTRCLFQSVLRFYSGRDSSFETGFIYVSFSVFTCM